MFAARGASGRGYLASYAAYLGLGGRIYPYRRALSYTAPIRHPSTSLHGDPHG